MTDTSPTEYATLLSHFDAYVRLAARSKQNAAGYRLAKTLAAATPRGKITADVVLAALADDDVPVDPRLELFVIVCTYAAQIRSIAATPEGKAELRSWIVKHESVA